MSRIKKTGAWHGFCSLHGPCKHQCAPAQDYAFQQDPNGIEVPDRPTCHANVSSVVRPLTKYCWSQGATRNSSVDSVYYNSRLRHVSIAHNVLGKSLCRSAFAPSCTIGHVYGGMKALLHKLMRGFLSLHGAAQVYQCGTGPLFVVHALWWVSILLGLDGKPCGMFAFQNKQCNVMFVLEDIMRNALAWVVEAFRPQI
jgi:hypothetical protein